MTVAGGKERGTAVLEVGGLLRASSQNVVTARLGRRPGVLEVEVNPVAQTATVVFDPARTSPPQLRDWVREYGSASTPSSPRCCPATRQP
jgi:Cu2+-exporting ATPase